MNKMSKQEKLILIYVGLFCATLIVLAFLWRSDKYYSNAYAPIVEKSERNKAIIEQNRRTEQARYSNSDSQGSGTSSQPRPAGFREQDIDKNRGDRFSTY